MFGSQRSPHIKPITFIISPHCSPPAGKCWLYLVTHVTPACDLTELSQLNISFEFLQKRNFSERQRTKVSSRDVSRDFFSSYWASSHGPTQLIIRLTALQKSKTTLERVIQANRVNLYCIKLRKAIRTNPLIKSIITHHFSDLSINTNNCICRFNLF